MEITKSVSVSSSAAGVNTDDYELQLHWVNMTSADFWTQTDWREYIHLLRATAPESITAGATTQAVLQLIANHFN